MKYIRRIRRLFCKHNYQPYWKGEFGRIICKIRYFEEDTKIIACEKCGKIKQL